MPMDHQLERAFFGQARRAFLARGDVSFGRAQLRAGQLAISMS
jgi:hypothetical protein